MEPIQPKRPFNGAFGQFLAAHRADFIKACVGERAPRISAIASEAWKKLSAEQKRPYQRLFEEAKITFQKDMAVFLAAGGTKVLGVRAMKTQKKKEKAIEIYRRNAVDSVISSNEKDLVQPKRPVGGAFGQFLAAHRPDFMEACKSKKASVISVVASEAWKKLTTEQKTPYQQRFIDAKAKFEEDMMAFVAAGGTKVSKARKWNALEDMRRVTSAKLDPISPTMPTSRAFNVFLRRKRALLEMQCPCLVRTYTDLASVMWTVMSDAERRPYECEYIVKKEVYDKTTESSVHTCGGTHAERPRRGDAADDASAETA